MGIMKLCIPQNYFFNVIRIAFLTYTVCNQVVCRVVQEAVVPHHEYIDKKTKNIIFTAM